MPGKYCDGKADDHTDMPKSKLFCDGFAARVASASATNPYNQTDLPLDYAIYQRGLDYGASLAGQTLTRAQVACCAGSGQTVAT